MTMAFAGGFEPLEHGPVRGFFDPAAILVARKPASAVGVRLSPKPPIEPVLPRVSRLYINASQCCNLRCRYCFADAGRRYDGDGRMAPDLAFQAVDLALDNLDATAPHLRLVFFGGEPWIDFDLCCRLLDFAASRARHRGIPLGLSGLFVTNFTLATAGDLDRLAGLPVDISVSLDGGRESHDRYRVFANGRGSWDRVVTNVRKLRSRIPGALSAICTVTPDGLDLVGAVQAILSEGFDQMCVRHVFTRDARVSIEGEVARLIAAYEESARWNLGEARAGRPAEFELFRGNFEILRNRIVATYPCGAGREWFTVTTAGRLYPCPEFAPDLPVGDVRTGFDLAAVTRFCAETGVRPGRPCTTCRARPFCRGGCAAESLHLAGRPDATLPERCRLARAIADIACGLYLELSEHYPKLLARYTGYRRSELHLNNWPDSVARPE